MEGIEVSCKAISHIKKLIAQKDEKYAEELKKTNEYEAAMKIDCPVKASDQPAKVSENKEGDENEEDKQNIYNNKLDHQCYEFVDNTKAELSSELQKEATKLLDDEFSRRFGRIRGIPKCGDYCLKSLERVMKFADELGLQLVTQAAYKLKKFYKTKLDEEKLPYLAKMVSKDTVDIKPHKEEKESREDNTKKEKKHKPKRIITEDDCDALGYLQMIKDAKNALSQKNEEGFIDLILAMMETFPLCSYVQQKKVVQLLETGLKNISKSN